jgi:hypothetical protein
MRLRNKTVVQLLTCAHTIPLVGNFPTMLDIYNAFVLLQILVILLVLYYWFLYIFLLSPLCCVPLYTSTCHVTGLICVVLKSFLLNLFSPLSLLPL